MKKLNLLFTALLLMCCVGNAKAVEVTIDGIKYDVITKAKQATVIRGGNYSGNIVIPSEITYNNVTCSVTSIGEQAFYQCSGLTSITIPNSVTSIGDRAFIYCSGLKEVHINDIATWCNIYIENYYANPLSNAHNLYLNNELITELVIPNGVTSIKNYAFENCSGLTSITIPNSVTSIESRAFEDCSGLTSITIPNSVTSIGSSAFSGCSGLKEVHINDIAAWCNINFESSSANPLSNAHNLYLNNELITELVIPNGVTSIKNYAFENCSGLTSITIPNSVTSIESRAFEDCSGLTSITIPNSVTSIGSGAFYNCKGLTSATIGNSITSIGDEAFRDCSGLTSITIPNSVTSIGYQAFRDCSGLTSITIPNSVTSIGEAAFANCSGLTSITIPNSVTSIGKSTFYSCEGLTSVTIGNSVTSIGNWAFYNCKGLTSITIPNSVTSIGNYAFQYCDGLTNITIPNSVTSIGNYAFQNCSGLTSITIPNSVTSIGEYAFYECSGLTSVTIGNSVTSIESGAFSDCENLTDVYCLATDVPTTKSDAFSGSYPEYMTLHVPDEAINNYKTTKPWSNFGSIVTLDGEIVEPEVKICATPTISYNNGKLSFECETEGAEFVTEVTSNDFNKFYDSEINFSATYNISVYATAEGYENSDIVNATLCWIECDCDADDNTDIINIPAKAVLVTSNNGTINISCSLEGENVAVYSSNAMFIGSTTIENGCASIQSGLSKGNIAIIKIGEKSIKVILN